MIGCQESCVWRPARGDEEALHARGLLAECPAYLAGAVQGFPAGVVAVAAAHIQE